MDDVVLAGGNMAGAVVRRGSVVLKPALPSTPTVQRLAAHLRANGLSWVPEPLGSSDGHARWQFLEGEVVHDRPDWLWSHEVLRTVAIALREWHDASATFEHRPDDVWWWPGKEPAEVVCHVDFAPYNHVFRNRTFAGVIDLDICYPAPRLWDLAYTAYRYVPLTPNIDDPVADGDFPDRTSFSRVQQQARLAEFLNAYAGHDEDKRYPASALLGMIVARLDAMVDWCFQQEDEQLIANGRMYRAHGKWIGDGALGEALPTVVADRVAPGDT